MEFRKNDLVTLEIEDCGIDGEGIGKADGFTVFVKDAVIGDTVTAKIIKAKKNYSEKKMRPGDLICFGGSKAKKNGRYKRIYHIAIYIGNGKTMESSSTYNNVVIRDRGVFKKSEIPVVVRP